MTTRAIQTLFALLFFAVSCRHDAPAALDLSKPDYLPPAVSIPRPQAAPVTQSQSLTVTSAGKDYKITFAGPITIEPAGVVTPPKDTVVVPPVVALGGVAGIGVNTFPWVPLDKLQMFSTLRCYIASGWIWRPGGLFIQPMYQAETAVTHGLDEYFQRAKDMGIDILPCINQTPEWYRTEGNGTGSNDFPPIKPGKDRTDPKSYADYAEFWFQFVARYGSVKHPESALRVDQTPRWTGDIQNVKKSGLGLIRAVEVGNEFDRWWDKGTEKYVTPKEHAAMLTAVIEAIRRADPSIKIVMAGLTGFDVPYLREMDAAFKAIGKPWPDVVNIHHYSHEGNQLGKWPPTWWLSGAVYPENDKDFAGINDVVAFARSIGRPVWCTEFGADSRPQSWMHIQGSRYGLTDEQAQGELLVRSIKAYRLAGVDRSYIFTAVDEPGSANGGLWQNCGIMTNEQTGYQPKAAYSAVRALIEEIKAKQN